MQKNRIDTLLKFLEEDPNDSFIMFALAKEYEKIGTLKKALDTYMQLREMDPNYVGLYYHLAALQLELKLPDEALVTYDQGMIVAKKAADFHALSELHTARTNMDIDN